MSQPPSAPPSVPQLSQPPSVAGSVVSAPPPSIGSTQVVKGVTHGEGFAEEAAGVIGRFLGDKEKVKKLALGERYEVVKLDDKLLVEAAEDFRQAKIFNELRLNEGVRGVELEERLKLVNIEEKIILDERERLGAAAGNMMRTARRIFNKEVEAARWLEQQKFESDKKFIVDAERSRLVKKRRAFEINTTAPVTHPTPAPPGDITLVMTVALGPAHEEVLTVREGDDYTQLASQFAATHRLPRSVIDPLVEEIKRNVAVRRGQSRSPSAASYDPR